MDDGPGTKLAHHLGRALQLTNILRDLDEDAAIGRLYLPQEFLGDEHIAADDPVAALAKPAIDGACRAIARLAHHHYAEADKVLAARPKGQLRAPRLMGAVYSAILARMEKQGWAPPRQRARIGKAELMMIVLRNGFG
jgi:phytoene synthase